MSKRYASCPNRIEQTWSIAYQNRFSQLHYFKNNETFFYFVKTVVIWTPISSCHQKTIKILNNIVIVQLMTNRRLNILSDIWRFDTSVNWKILGKEFETWLADSFLYMTLVTIGMYVTNLGYLEDRSPCFMVLLEGSIKKSNRMLVGLDITVVILETNHQDLPDPIDLKVKWANKKKERAKKYR